MAIFISELLRHSDGNLEIVTIALFTQNQVFYLCLNQSFILYFLKQRLSVEKDIRKGKSNEFLKDVFVTADFSVNYWYEKFIGCYKSALKRLASEIQRVEVLYF